MAVQHKQQGFEVPAWIESKITMISEKERALYLEFCGDISHLSIRDKSREKQIKTMASKALSSAIGKTAIDSILPKTRKAILLAFGELQPDFSVDEATREFIQFLSQHGIVNQNLVDVHGIKKGAWLGSEYPSIVFPKLISTSVVIYPIERSVSKLAETMSLLVRSVKREPVNYETNRVIEGVAPGFESSRRAGGM